MRQLCPYCGSHSPDDQRGNCGACGGPRSSFADLETIASQRRAVGLPIVSLVAEGGPELFVWGTGQVGETTVLGW